MAQAGSSLDATIRQAAQLVRAAEYVTALTGAGISVESGIPPFRGPGGLWTKYGEPPMDGYQRFLQDPKKAWEERLAPTGASQEMRETIARANRIQGTLPSSSWKRWGCYAGSSPRMWITSTAVLGVATCWKFTAIRPWYAV